MTIQKLTNHELFYLSCILDDKTNELRDDQIENPGEATTPIFITLCFNLVAKVQTEIDNRNDYNAVNLSADLRILSREPMG